MVQYKYKLHNQQPIGESHSRILPFTIVRQISDFVCQFKILLVGTFDNDDLVDEFTNDVRGGQEARFSWWPSVAIPTPILQLYNSARGVHIWLSDLLQPVSWETRPTGEGCCITTEEDLY
jgi:hypothetical protein